MTATVAKPAPKRSEPKSRDVGRDRGYIDPNSPDVKHRFGLKLRELLDANHMNNGELADRLNELGVKLTREAVAKWVRGINCPEISHLEAIASVLIPGKDYRELLPEPLRNKRGRGK